MPFERVIRSLDRIIEWRGKPDAIRCENGLEYISVVTLAWAARRGIRINFIQPGSLSETLTLSVTTGPSAKTIQSMLPSGNVLTMGKATVV